MITSPSAEIVWLARHVVAAHAGDPAVGDDDVGRLDAAVEDVDDLPAGDQQVARLLAERDADPAPGRGRLAEARALARSGSLLNRSRTARSSSTLEELRTPREAGRSRP